MSAHLRVLYVSQIDPNVFAIVILVPNELLRICAYYTFSKLVSVYLRLLYVIQIDLGAFPRIIRVPKELRRICAYYMCSK